MKTTIYYFTGTGNSLKVAKDLSENLEDCELMPVPRIWRKERLVSTSEKVGFIFPLYYYGLPKIIHEFANKIDLDKSRYFFAVITRAGDENGAPLIQLEKILRKKSKTLDAGFFIKMPDNYILLEDVISEEEQKGLFEKAKEEIENIAQIIRENKKFLDIGVINEKENQWESRNNKFCKNVNMSDKSFFVDDRCTACGTCEEICPVNNIKLVEGKPEWQHECQQCLACINFCPENSIQYGKKTIGRKRYHHPEIIAQDIINQKK